MVMESINHGPQGSGWRPKGSVGQWVAAQGQYGAVGVGGDLEPKAGQAASYELYAVVMGGHDLVTVQHCIKSKDSNKKSEQLLIGYEC